MADEIINNVAMRRYELPIADDATAMSYYRFDDGRVVLLHTEVPSEFGGQGIGKVAERDMAVPEYAKPASSR